MDNNVVVFYHKADLDGVSSAATINLYELKKQNTTITLIGVDYTDDIDVLEKTKDSDTVYVVDFSFSPFEKMIQLNKNRNLIWIDHHRSSIQRANEYPNQKFKGILGNNSKSACALVWEYLYDKEIIPYTLYQISLYDTWQHESNEDLLNFYSGLQYRCNLDPTHDIWKKLLTHHEFHIASKIINDGKIINDNNAYQSEKYASEHAFETEFEGLRTIALNIGFSGSKKFDSVYNEDNHDIMVAFCLNKDKKWRCSIYSTKYEIDCASIAMKYGGGGHKGAAGFITDEFPLKI